MHGDDDLDFVLVYAHIVRARQLLLHDQRNMPGVEGRPWQLRAGFSNVLIAALEPEDDA
jgi:hypothetical protein